MTTATARRPAARGGVVAGALLALLALLASACTADPDPDPAEALVQTVEDTLAGSFAYRLVAEADREALDALGSQLGAVAARLNLVEVTGVVADGTVTADLRVLATEPLFQLRRYDDDRVHVRLATGDGPLAALATPELEGQLLGMALQTGQSNAVIAAIGALFDGSWVAVTGQFDPGLLAGLGTGSPPDEATDGDAQQELATPLPDVVADYLTVTERSEDDGGTTLRVDLQARELLRALARLGGDADVAAVEDGLALLPEVVTGDVVTRDGVVEAIVFDVAEGARQAGQDVPGSLEVRLELSDHGDPTVPEPPDPLVTVPSDELATGLAQLLATPPPAPPTGSSSPTAP